MGFTMVRYDMLMFEAKQMKLPNGTSNVRHVARVAVLQFVWSGHHWHLHAVGDGILDAL
jgi:hypothetical protein